VREARDSRFSRDAPRVDAREIAVRGDSREREGVLLPVQRDAREIRDLGLPMQRDIRDSSFVLRDRERELVLDPRIETQPEWERGEWDQSAVYARAHTGNAGGSRFNQNVNQQQSYQPMPIQHPHQRQQQIQAPPQLQAPQQFSQQPVYNNHQSQVPLPPQLLVQGYFEGNELDVDGFDEQAQYYQQQQQQQQQQQHILAQQQMQQQLQQQQLQQQQLQQQQLQQQQLQQQQLQQQHQQQLQQQQQMYQGPGGAGRYGPQYPPQYVSNSNS